MAHCLETDLSQLYIPARVQTWRRGISLGYLPHGKFLGAGRVGPVDRLESLFGLLVASPVIVFELRLLLLILGHAPLSPSIDLAPIFLTAPEPLHGLRGGVLAHRAYHFGSCLHL